MKGITKNEELIAEASFEEVTPAKITHDMNQPLNSIKMISGGILYLLNQGKKIPEEELAECMKEISCQTDRVVAIMKQLKG